ncbi:MAG TPA: DUF885 domain-containing protein [Nevskiaceae bacterium]|nr:DUF885 domain-containing protein [Nevskiaceae bacterium]
MNLLPRLALCAVLVSPWVQAATPDETFAHDFGDAFLDRYWSYNTDAAVQVGYYKYADRLVVPDAAWRKNYLAFLDASLKQLAAVDEKKLGPNTRADYAILKNQLESQRWTLTDYRDWEWNPANYNVADPFALLQNTAYADAETRLRAISARLAAVPAYYSAAKLAVNSPVREYTQLAIEQNQGALDVFGDDLEKMVAGSRLTPAERATLFDRIGAARRAITDYVAFLKHVDAAQKQNTRSFRVGRKLYEQKFAYDIQTGDSAEQLYQRALAEKEKLHAHMDQLADQLWPKYMGNAPKPTDRLDKIAAVIGKISEQHAAREEFVPQVKALIPQLTQWISDHHLVTLDPTRPLAVRDTPPYKRGFSVASLDAPGPYDATAQTWFNVTPLDAYTPEQAESFLREYNRYTMQVLAIHEALPGHYVQLLYANKSPSRIKSVFGNGAMIEGWAVYSERMMLESGWGNDAPEMWLMYSKWNLRVVCNTILDYSLHNLDLQEADAMKLLTREAFQSQTEATGKWRRARLSVIQLDSYFAGFSAIYDFREQQKRELGRAFDLEKFHEQFLSYGSAPVGVIKQLMTAH